MMKVKKQGEERNQREEDLQGDDQISKSRKVCSVKKSIVLP